MITVISQNWIIGFFDIVEYWWILKIGRAQFFKNFKGKINVLVINDQHNIENYKWLYRKAPKCVLKNIEIVGATLEMKQISKILHTFSHVKIVYMARIVINHPESVLKINPKTRFQIEFLSIDCRKLSQTQYKNIIYAICENY